MKKIYKILNMKSLALMLLILVTLVPHIRAETLIIEPMEDTYIDSSSPTDNYVGSWSLYILSAIFSTLPKDESITLLKFVLSNKIPVGANINSAKLRMMSSSISSTTPHIAVYKYSFNDWDPMIVNWDNFHNGSYEYLSEIPVPYPEQYYYWNLPISTMNTGILTLALKSTRASAGYESVFFESFNHYNQSVHPVLIINYTTTTPIPTATPISPEMATLEISDFVVPIGSIIDVPIQAHAPVGKNIAGVDINISYNPSVIVVDDITSQVFPTLVVNIDNTHGQTKIVEANINGISGSMTIANIRFRPIGLFGSTSNVSITVNHNGLIDSNGIPLSSIVTNGVTTVGLMGDVDSKPGLDVGDVLFVAQALVGLRKFTPEQTLAGDVDSMPGLDVGDVLFIAQTVAGLRKM